MQQMQQRPMLQEEILDEKIRKWRQLNGKRYEEKRKFDNGGLRKEKMPPEVLRLAKKTKIIKSNNDDYKFNFYKKKNPI